jgi:hypothetical protein
MFTHFQQFQATTEQDKIKIDQVATRTTALLPSNQKLNADLRQKMDKATEKMQAAIVMAEENRQKATENCELP